MISCTSAAPAARQNSAFYPSRNTALPPARTSCNVSPERARESMRSRVAAAFSPVSSPGQARRRRIGDVRTSMDLGLVEARDERREELAQYRGPFGVLGAARGVPHIAVELEIRSEERRVGKEGRSWVWRE